MKCCFATVVSGDGFRYFIPPFLYSIAKAYPEYHTQVFVRGGISKQLQRIISLVPGKNFTIHKNAFTQFPTRTSTCNTLRHLIPPHYFEGFDYLYITDVDMVILRQDPTHVHYHSQIMEETGMPFSSFRGPYKRPKRPEIYSSWRRLFRRLVDGTLMLKLPEWHLATEEARHYYWNVVQTGGHDDYDEHPSCSYREYNEVMLQRICRKSGLKTPKKPKYFLNKQRFNYKYRDLHLGDFKPVFNKRWQSLARMYDKFPQANVKLYHKLSLDPVWKKLVAKCCEEEYMVKKMFRNVERHMEVRL